MRKTCYVSAPFGRDISPLTSVLDSFGVVWEWAKEVESADIGNFSGVRNLIRRSDFLVAVLGEETERSRVLLEAGIAVGLGKPMLLVSTSSKLEKDGASLLTGSLISLLDREALIFHLGVLLRSLESKRTAPKKQKKIWPPHSSRIITGSSQESSIESQVALAIETAGGSVSLRPQENPGRFAPDLIAWLPSSEFFNPAAIELKLKAESSAVAERQLSEFLAASDIKTGFVLVGDPTGLELRPTSSSNAIIFRLGWSVFFQVS